MTRSTGQDERRTAIPILEESARVDKVEVDRGGFRISKRVHAVEHSIEEILHDKRVLVERRAINAPVAEPPPPRHEGDTLVLSVVEEVLVVRKELRLVEEVRITARDEARPVTETVFLRKEAIDIERISPGEPSQALPTPGADPKGEAKPPPCAGI